MAAGCLRWISGLFLGGGPLRYVFLLRWLLLRRRLPGHLLLFLRRWKFEGPGMAPLSELENTE